jgi:hypothetical protein
LAALLREMFRRHLCPAVVSDVTSCDYRALASITTTASTNSTATWPRHVVAAATATAADATAMLEQARLTLAVLTLAHQCAQASV